MENQKGIETMVEETNTVSIEVEEEVSEEVMVEKAHMEETTITKIRTRP
jgi:hypothetical protein